MYLFEFTSSAQLHTSYSTSKTLMWEREKRKKTKRDEEKEKYASDWERGVKNYKHETVQVSNSYLFYLFYSPMALSHKHM
jgi:hypothetical protein